MPAALNNHTYNRRVYAAERSFTHGDGIYILTDEEFIEWFELFASDGLEDDGEYFCMSLCFYAAMAQ